MINWYKMHGALEDFERNPAYYEKLAIDADIELVKNVIHANKQTFCRTDCSGSKSANTKRSRFAASSPSILTWIIQSFMVCVAVLPFIFAFPIIITAIIMTRR